MKNFVLFTFITISAFCQNEGSRDSIYFSEVLLFHYAEFQRKASLDFNKYKSSKEHFRLLVDSKLKGTILDNFEVSSFNQKINHIYQLKMPVYLMSYSSWCVPSNGELEALELVVDKHSSWIDFVLLMWDNKKDALQFSKQFHRKIKVIYVNELYNYGSKTIKILKHKFGVPVSFTMSSNKTIINIRKNTQIHPTVKAEIATKTCYEGILSDIKLLQEFENQ